MEWPFRRFLRAFDAFQRRVACDELRERKNMLVAALHSNSNLDGEGNDRRQIVRDLERSYDNAIADVWNGTVGQADKADEESWGSDLMRAGRRHTNVAPELPGESVIRGLPG